MASLWLLRRALGQHGGREENCDHSEVVDGTAPDGLVAVGTEGGRVRLMDVATGMVPLNELGHTELITSVALSAEFRVLATASRDRSVKVWDLSTGEEELHVPGHDGDGDCRCSMDKRGDCSMVHRACPVEGHSAAITAVCFRGDAQLLATGGADRQVIVWSRTGEVEARLRGHSHGVHCVAFSPDGVLLASGGSRTVHVWNVHSGEALHEIAMPPPFSVRTVLFSPDGGRIAGGSWEGLGFVWDLQNRGEMLSFEQRMTMMSLAFSPNGRVLASGGDFSIRLWDTASGRELLCLLGHDPSNGCVCEQAFKGENECPRVGHRHAVLSLDFSHDGTALASGSEDGSLKLWDVREALSANPSARRGGTLLCTVKVGMHVRGVRAGASSRKRAADSAAIASAR